MPEILSEQSDAHTISQLKSQGYKAVDVHVHTSHSHDVPEAAHLHPTALYHTAKEHGMDYVVFTDHDSTDAHTHNLDTVRAVELTVRDPFIGYELHLNIYELTEDDFSYLQLHMNDVQKILTYCEKNTLPVIYNHPFTFEVRDLPTILRHPRRTLKRILWLAERIDVIELNHSRPKILTRLVKPLAKHFDTAIITASDTHTGQVGVAYTLAQGDTFREWYTNVKNHNAVLVHKLSTETYFDTEAYHYMNNVLQPQKKAVLLQTNNTVADALIRLNSKYKRLATIITPIVRPVVALATKSGLARKWYENSQAIVANLFQKRIFSLKR